MKSDRIFVGVIAIVLFFVLIANVVSFIRIENLNGNLVWVYNTIQQARLVGKIDAGIIIVSIMIMLMAQLPPSDKVSLLFVVGMMTSVVLMLFACSLSILTANPDYWSFPSNESDFQSLIMILKLGNILTSIVVALWLKTIFKVFHK